MISRKSTKIIADAYAAHFKSPFAGGTNSTFGTVYRLKDEEAYNFLYEREYELWFLQVMARYTGGPRFYLRGGQYCRSRPGKVGSGSGRNDVSDLRTGNGHA